MASIKYKKWDVVLVDLNPVKGKEISKIRPCLIISPTAANQHLYTLIVAPLTSTIRGIPTRLLSQFGNQQGEICFDQMRAVDKTRVVKRIGVLAVAEQIPVNTLLATMFSEL